MESFVDGEQLTTVLMGVDTDKLKEWLTAISKEKANEYLERVSHQQQVADSRQGLRSYIGSFFHGSRSRPAAPTQNAAGPETGAEKPTGTAPQTEDDEFEDAMDA